MARSELTQRLLVAAVAIPLVVLAAYFGGWVLGALLALFAAGGALELYRLALERGTRPFTVAGAATAAALVATATLIPDPVAVAPVWMLLLLLLTLWCVGAAVWQRGPEGMPLAASGATLLGTVLCGFGLAYAVFLRHMLPESADAFPPPDTLGLQRVLATSLPADVRLGPWVGVCLVAYPLVLTWVSDTCAYFFGRAFGVRKLIPTVSPGKTVVGALAGMAGSVVAGALLGHFVLAGWIGLPVHWIEGALAGVIFSGAAQIGDLAESLMKREAGVKDSGTLFPGHGGVLDRLDALLFTLPIGYWVLLYIVSPDTFRP